MGHHDSLKVGQLGRQAIGTCTQVAWSRFGDLQFHRAAFHKTLFYLAQEFSYLLLLICFANLLTAAATMSH